MSYVLESSENVTTRMMKLLFWGATGTRKTETVLRYFPSVLILDAEGNTDQCVDMEEIPPFQRVKTKDPRVIMEVLRDVAAGKIKNKGVPIQTICLDSISVVWALQGEVASKLAEKRAIKYNKPLEDAITTQIDWVVAKRPMKAIQIAMTNLPIPYVIFIAREKEPFSDDGTKKPVAPDTIKNFEHDMNLALHFISDEGNKWHAEVTKVQGKLGRLFPKGARVPVFPTPEFFEYARNIHVSAEGDDEDNLTDQLVTEETDKKTRTFAALQAYAESKGIPAAQLGTLLKKNNFTGYKPELHDAMVAVIDAANGNH